MSVLGIHASSLGAPVLLDELEAMRKTNGD
jgi:hypothetical protein